MIALTFSCYFFIFIFFLKSIETCRLCVTYVEGQQWFQCIGYEYMAHMDLNVRERALNLKSLTRDPVKFSLI